MQGEKKILSRKERIFLSDGNFSFSLTCSDARVQESHLLTKIHYMIIESVYKDTVSCMVKSAYEPSGPIRPEFILVSVA